MTNFARSPFSAPMHLLFSFRVHTHTFAKHPQREAEKPMHKIFMRDWAAEEPEKDP